MRAIVQDRYGSPEHLRVAELDPPTLTDNGVLVRVHASSINAGDWRRVRAAPFVIRAVEGWRRPRNPQLGGDAAGVVEAVGSAVTHVAPGDRAYGIRTGSLAEMVNGRSFVLMPSNLSFEEAAAVPIAGVTALQAVRDHGRAQRGDRVLVNGAGGGVGSMAVQIAKADGAEVTAVTGPRTIDLVRSLGADRVVDYGEEDFTETVRDHDVVIDIGGNRSIRALRRTLKTGGRLVLVGAGAGRLGPMTRLAGGLIRKRLLRQPIAMFIAAVRVEDLDALTELIEAGRLRPAIDRTYPLEQVPEAMAYVESGRARGKVVISVLRGEGASGDGAPRGSI
jgi:NADPH:quinone reductase-like Zn-dependent oxidoreductase